MRSLTSSLVVAAAVLSWGCESATAPSSPSALTVFELRLAESPSCAVLTAGNPGNFFKFGAVTVHVKGSFSQGTFLLVDDSLATFAPQCTTSQARPALQLGPSSAAAGVVSGRMDGVWFPAGCPGNYVGAQGTVNGTRDGTSAGGVLDGSLVNGIFALNFAGSCPATDHRWWLTPVGAPPG